MEMTTTMAMPGTYIIIIMDMTMEIVEAMEMVMKIVAEMKIEIELMMTMTVLKVKAEWEEIGMKSSSFCDDRLSTVNS